LWIEQTLNLEHKVQEAIEQCDEELGIEPVIPKDPPKFGYRGALLMLAVAAIVAIFVDVVLPCLRVVGPPR
jgi:hypothetical protein